jgi:hypothetical protein
MKCVKDECELVERRCARANIPYSVYPDAPGLLPWGRDENGSVMLWLTEGEPNDWPIVLVRIEGGHERWDLSLTSFLAGTFGNRIKCLLWGRFEAEELTFDRGRNQAEVWEEIRSLRQKRAT